MEVVDIMPGFDVCFLQIWGRNVSFKPCSSWSKLVSEPPCKSKFLCSFYRNTHYFIWKNNNKAVLLSFWEANYCNEVHINWSQWGRSRLPDLSFADFQSFSEKGLFFFVIFPSPKLRDLRMGNEVCLEGLMTRLQIVWVWAQDLLNQSF